MKESELPEITTRICEIIAESTDFSAEDLQARSAENLNSDLGIDSLTILEIVLSVDQEFKTDFTEEELFGMQTIEGATEMVAERLGQAKEGASA
jgi:acyl carrier protein